MSGGKRAALFVLILIAALVIGTALMSIRTWRDRINPTVVNQPPATQGPTSTPGS